MKAIILNGHILCPKCLGTGKELSGNFSNSDALTIECKECEGDGIREPTWTEKIIYGKDLKYKWVRK